MTSIQPSAAAHVAVAETPVKVEDLDLPEIKVAARPSAASTSSAGVSAVATATPAATGAVTAEDRKAAGDAFSKYRLDIIAMVKDQGRFAEAEAIAAKVDHFDQAGIASFGMDVQRDASGVSTKMLEGVKTKALGETSEVLTKIRTTMTGFDMNIAVKEPSRVARWFGKAKDAAAEAADALVKAIDEFKTRQTEVNKVLEGLSDDLTVKSDSLAKRMVELKQLYSASVSSLRSVELHIAAGTLALDKMYKETIPQLKIDAAKNPANVELAGKLDAAIQTAAEMDRRLGALNKAHTFLGQRLPSIGQMVKTAVSLISLINEIQTTTLDQWKQLLAQAITMKEQSSIAEHIAAFSQLTDKMIVDGAKNLHQNSVKVAEMLERGITSPDALREANGYIIAMLNDTLSIAEKASAERKTAEDGMLEDRKKLVDTMAGVESARTN